jgi:hypothetical protein
LTNLIREGVSQHTTPSFWDQHGWGVLKRLYGTNTLQSQFEVTSCNQSTKHDNSRRDFATTTRAIDPFSSSSELDQYNANVFSSQNSSEWDESQSIAHHDPIEPSFATYPQAAAAIGNHKAPLAPKQELGGSQANSRGQHSSPISGTYALRTPRGKITSIACESCRKRKSKVRCRGFGIVTLNNK